MKTKIIIRKADSSSDVQSILKMYKKLDEYHVELIPHVFKKSNKFRKEEIIKNEIDNNNSGYLVADYQGEIVGFINYKINENYKLPIFKKYKYILIENVIVLPEYRNKNIGTKLIKEIIKIGKKNKIRYVNTVIWNENELSKSLFNKNKFKTLWSRLELEI